MRIRLAILFAAVLTGCMKQQPLAWRLPPASLALTPPALPVKVAAGKTPCPATEGITITKRGRSLRIEAASAVVASKPSGWLRQWGNQLEASGCIPQGAAPDVARLVADSIALDPARAYALLHEEERVSGYVDLGPENRLQLTAPLMRAGADANAPLIESSKVTGAGNQLTIEAKTTADLIGYEVVAYSLKGGHIAALNSERHIDGKTEKVSQPTREYLSLPAAATTFRLVYKAQLNDQGITELLVAGRTESELEALSKQVVARGDCPPDSHGMCIAIPRRIAVNPFIAVMVNGAEVALQRNATVADALAAAGAKNPRAVPPSLTLLKSYRGKLTPVQFDSGAQNILSLHLLGGEQLSWHD